MIANSAFKKESLEFVERFKSMNPGCGDDHRNYEEGNSVGCNRG